MSAKKSISLEDLIALNDEIAALTRVGVPLRSGLGGIDKDYRGRLGRLAVALNDKLEQGEPLSDALSNDIGIPPFYQAMVLAGMKSGRLPAALEGLSTSLRRVSEMRKVVSVALIYPFIVFVVGICVFGLLAKIWAPNLNALRTQLNVDADPWLQAMAWMGEHPIWLPCMILAFVVLWFIWRLRSRSASSVETRGRGTFLGLPTLATLRHHGRMAMFAELLALMVREEVPIHDALALSSRATGDRRLQNAAKQVADRLEQGESIQVQQLPAPFPPLLGWLIASGETQPRLIAGLQQMSDVYRRRADRLATWMTLYLPIIMTITIGGSIVFFQLLAIWVPWLRLLTELSLP